MLLVGKTDDFFLDALVSLWYLQSCWKPGTYGTQFSELNLSLRSANCLNSFEKNLFHRKCLDLNLKGFSDSLGGSLSLLELQYLPI